MLRPFRKQILWIMSLFIIIVTCTGCNYQDVYTNRKWLADLADKTGILNYTNDEPYFEKVQKDDEDFACIQALVEWGVINKTDDIDFEAGADRDFVAYTLESFLDNDETYEIEDAAKSHWHADFDKMVANNIWEVDRGQKKKKKEVSKKEAEIIIDKVLNVINHREFVSESKFSYNEAKIQDSELFKVDKDLYQSSYKLKSDDVVLTDEGYKTIIDGDDGLYLTKDSSPLEVFEELYFASSEPLDFSKAYIEEVLEFKDDASLYNDDRYQRMANSSDTRVVEKDGFYISYKLGINHFDLYVSKKTSSGINAFLDASIYDIRPSYRWHHRFGKIEDAYFKVDFKTSEEVGLNKGKYNNLYADFSFLSADDLFNSLKNLMKPKEDVIDSSLTLFKIHLPIPNLPLVEFTIDVKLNMYLSGKIEIALSTDHEVGLEIKDNHFRTIFNNDYSCDGIINATASSTLNLGFNLVALNQELCDLTSKVGIKAKAQATLHLYDKDGKIKSQAVQSEYDDLNEILKDNSDLALCGDLSLSWVLNFIINSNDTLASRFGLSKTFDILDEDDQIFGNKSHFEDGMFVEKCTRKDRLPLVGEELETIDTDAIILSKYSLVVKGDTEVIDIKALPSGYSHEDLIYESSDESVAIIDGGKIVAVKPGACKIRIATKDDKYEAYLNVLISYDQISN